MTLKITMIYRQKSIKIFLNELLKVLLKETALQFQFNHE